jgi:transposase-like protein
MSNAFTAPHFQSHELAREWLEQTRWADGPVCSHCGSLKSYKIKKPGWYRCGEPECRKDFTVTTGTVMERSKIPLNKWLMAFYMLNSSKKGVSSHQLHRALGLDYKSAWFMTHRIREAMRDGGLEPLGGEGKIVEADETYYGRAKKKNNLKKRYTPYTKGGWKDKGAARPIVALVERGGNVRTFHVAHADKVTVSKIVKENVARESRLHTDESRLYTGADAHFAAHETVHHSSGEYVRYEDGAAVHTNSAEGYFSIFKRGMRGIYQHCGEKHLHRYLAEYDHRYNHRVALGYSDIDRTIIAIRGVAGKRLTYRQSNEARG